MRLCRDHVFTLVSLDTGSAVGHPIIRSIGPKAHMLRKLHIFFKLESDVPRYNGLGGLNVS